MYYTKINQSNTGFTNQIFSLISSIINAYKMGIKVVIVDKFLNNIKGDKFTPITEIFNITDINIFLKKTMILLL